MNITANKTFDVYKAREMLLRHKKFLIARSRNKEYFYAPGGKIERGETPIQSLIQELREELGISVGTELLESFGTFDAKVAGDETKTILMYVFFVREWICVIKPQNEIEEILWIDSNPPKKIKIGSIFAKQVLPRLKKQHLID